MDQGNEIREFLASRRARLTPEQAGLPAYGGHRRVPGLRREEVALLAGVSVDYYTQMERGNLGGVSDSVLDALARALQLDEAERSHLFDLARTANSPTQARPRSGPHRVRLSVQRLLDAMTGAPAYVRTGRLDILSLNRLGAALYAPVLDGQRLPDLVGELSTRSEAFRTRWAAHNVRLHRSGGKQLHDSVAGDPQLTYEALELPADPGLTIITYTAEPGSTSQGALDFLQLGGEPGPARPASDGPGARRRLTPTGPRPGRSITRSEMELQSKQASVKGPAERFTGDVWYDVITSGEPPSRVRVNVVRFTPGARNAWHAHAPGQTLHVTEGMGLIQSRGGQVIQIRAGDTIYTPPGEWHWHGAAPDHFMSHLAIWEAPDAGPESQWGDFVTDEEYSSR
jgi:quercetin dioxygenase-like cupin family protein/transcriptional regulator with XRE-family HTH domain